MKKIISIILIIAFLLFLTGCTDLIKDPHKNEDRMKFKENITINYGKKDVDTTKFVTGYDSYAISDVNRHKNSSTITIDNYIIKCPRFSATEMGQHTLTYKVDNFEYTLSVTVKDKEKPSITYSKEYDFTIEDKISKKDLFNIKDNLTKNDDLEISYKGKIKNKIGSYKIKCTAKDEAGNKSHATTIVHIYDKPSLSVSNSSFSLKTGQEMQIDAKTTGKDSKCIYVSENNSVATVNENGVVKANGSGQTTIHVKANGLEKNVAVTVEANEAKQQDSPAPSDNGTSKNNNSTNNDTTENKNNKSAGNSTSSNKNSSQYNKYFSGNSIDSYNSAYSYAESVMNSGKANGYSVMPDGNGFNVTFY